MSWCGSLWIPLIWNTLWLPGMIFVSFLRLQKFSANIPSIKCSAPFSSSGIPKMWMFVHLMFYKSLNNLFLFLFFFLLLWLGKLSALSLGSLVLSSASSVVLLNSSSVFFKCNYGILQFCNFHLELSYVSISLLQFCALLFLSSVSIFMTISLNLFLGKLLYQVNFINVFSFILNIFLCFFILFDSLLESWIRWNSHISLSWRYGLCRKCVVWTHIYHSHL